MTSPYLDLSEAAEYLRFKGKTPVDACRVFLKRYAVPTFKRGGRILVLRASLDAALSSGQRRIRRSA